MNPITAGRHFCWRMPCPYTHRILISRRRLHLVLTLLLPLMALRALLPAGYMPVSENGELRVVMCSQGLMQPGDPADNGNDRGDGHQLPPNAGECPFAHAMVAAPPVAATLGIAVPAPVLLFVSRTDGQLPPATGPPRRTPARAPPAFSA